MKSKIIVLISGIFILNILIAGCTQTEPSQNDELIQQSEDTSEIAGLGGCPMGSVDCEYPGDCWRYTDENDNKICDFSE